MDARARAGQLGAPDAGAVLLRRRVRCGAVRRALVVAGAEARAAGGGAARRVGRCPLWTVLARLAAADRVDRRVPRRHAVVVPRRLRRVVGVHAPAAAAGVVGRGVRGVPGGVGRRVGERGRGVVGAVADRGARRSTRAAAVVGCGAVRGRRRGVRVVAARGLPGERGRGARSGGVEPVAAVGRRAGVGVGSGGVGAGAAAVVPGPCGERPCAADLPGAPERVAGGDVGGVGVRLVARSAHAAVGRAMGVGARDVAARVRRCVPGPASVSPRAGRPRSSRRAGRPSRPSAPGPAAAARRPAR